MIRSPHICNCNCVLISIEILTNIMRVNTAFVEDNHDGEDKGMWKQGRLIQNLALEELNNSAVNMFILNELVR